MTKEEFERKLKEKAKKDSQKNSRMGLTPKATTLNEQQLIEKRLQEVPEIATSFKKKPFYCLK